MPNSYCMLFDSLSKTLDDMRWSPHQRFTLEIGLIKACTIAPLQPLSEVLAQMKELEARLAPGSAVSVPAASGVSEQPHRMSESSCDRHRTADSLDRIAKRCRRRSEQMTWGRVIGALKSKKPSLASFLAHSRIIVRYG